jgi:hypothetical protein
MSNAPEILAFCGFAGSGKNTAGDYILQMSHRTAQPSVQLAFAGALKDAVSVIFQWDRRLLDGDTDSSRLWREQVDERWTARLGRPITPRRVMQEVGTDVFRHHFHTDIWLMALAARLRDNTMHVITDARFGNEMHWVRAHGGTVVWVYRPTGMLDALLPRDRFAGAPRLTQAMFAPLREDSGLHASETSFLTEGAEQIHVVLMNVDNRVGLQNAAHHLHIMSQASERFELPWGSTTLYLRSVTDEDTAVIGDARFEWRYTLGDHCVSAYYNQYHHKVRVKKTHVGYNAKSEVIAYV